MLGNKNLLMYRYDGRGNMAQFRHCGIQECDPGYRYQFCGMPHPYHLIHFVLRGSGIFTIENRTFRVEAGQAFYIPAQKSGVYQASENNPWTYAWIGFYAGSFDAFVQGLFDNQYVVDIPILPAELEKMILWLLTVTDERLTYVNRYKREEFPGEQFMSVCDPVKSMEVNSRMLHLFSKLLEARAEEKTYMAPKKNYARDAKACIDISFCDNIRISHVADALHIHPNYLSAVFKKEYGQTPSEYLRMVRMEHASGLLVKNDYPVAVIAGAVGYANPFQFSNTFKKYYGISPGEYRKKNSKK